MGPPYKYNNNNKKNNNNNSLMTYAQIWNNYMQFTHNTYNKTQTNRSISIKVYILVSSHLRVCFFFNENCIVQFL
jgi:hypothetical protein